jgi:hypothetical protein
MRTETRMFSNILHTFSIVVDNVMEVFETLDVILFSDDSFHWFLLLVHSVIPVKLVLDNDRGTGIQAPRFLLTQE